MHNLMAVSIEQVQAQRLARMRCNGDRPRPCFFFSLPPCTLSPLVVVIRPCRAQRQAHDHQQCETPYAMHTGTFPVLPSVRVVVAPLCWHCCVCMHRYPFLPPPPGTFLPSFHLLPSYHPPCPAHPPHEPSLPPTSLPPFPLVLCLLTLDITNTLLDFLYLTLSLSLSRLSTRFDTFPILSLTLSCIL